MDFWDDNFLLAACSRAESRICGSFDIKQLSRNDYAITGDCIIIEPKYEKLTDSLGKPHFVKIGEDVKQMEITPDDCDESISILDADILTKLFGKDFSNFVLHYPYKIFIDINNFPKKVIAQNLTNRINSCLLEKQFYERLFFCDNSFLGQSFAEKGLRIGNSNYSSCHNSLKKIITGEESVVHIGDYFIEIRSLFEYWWTPEIRNILREEEYDYSYIYGIDNALTAATELFQIRSKLKPKAKIVYEY